MLELVFHPNLRVLPSARCSKHPSISIEPVSAWTSGKVTIVWACPACESEGEKETGTSYLLETHRKITLPPIDTCPADIEERET